MYPVSLLLLLLDTLRIAHAKTVLFRDARENSVGPAGGISGAHSRGGMQSTPGDLRKLSLNDCFSQDTPPHPPLPSNPSNNSWKVFGDRAGGQAEDIENVFHVCVCARVCVCVYAFTTAIIPEPELLRPA